MLITVIIIVVLVAALIGLFAAYHKTFYSPHRDACETKSPDFLMRHPYRDAALERTQRLVGMPCEFISVRSYDGLKLSARYYKGKEDKPLFICFHGYRGSAVKDMSGFGLYLIDEGFNVILVDERAHWRSQGHTITYGLRERRDVLSWLSYTEERFGSAVPVYLFGISMGGGTVVMASGQKLPDSVKGIIADCPLNSPKESIKHVCRKIKLNAELCWPIVWLSALIYGRLNISATTAADEVKKSEKPILIIHGDGDDFVPPYMSMEIKNANPDMVEYVSVPEAGHGLSWFYDTALYQRAVSEFMQNT